MEKGTAQISARATVKSVQNFIKFTDEQIIKTLDDNQDKLALTRKQQERWHKKCLCLVEFCDVKAIDPPLAFDHQGNMDDWLIFSKNDTFKTLSAHEALEEALCFGCIDGQMQFIDDDRYKKYFSRRRAKSNWSEKNKELMQRLIKRGLMTQQGLDAMSCAMQNGLWNNSKRNAASEEQIKTDVIQHF